MYKAFLSGKIFFLILILSSCDRKEEFILKDQGIKTLYVANWLGEEKSMNRLNKVFMEKYPHIKIVTTGKKGKDYDKDLLFTLRAGIAPDIIYLRSYDQGKVVYDTGFIEPLNDIVPLLKEFPQGAKNAWSDEDGAVYAVPSMGVIHGIFYNKQILKDHGLEPPRDWNGFIELCRELKDTGEGVISFGSRDSWYLYEVFYSALAPNFYGGEQSRQKLINREIFMNDPAFVNSFEALKELTPFFPENYQELGYDDMRSRFARGEAALYVGGSWDLKFMKAQGMDISQAGFFPPPPVHAGDSHHLSFHVDYGVALNRVSRYPEEARLYIQWVATESYARDKMSVFPGFYSYTPGHYTFEESVVQEIADSITGSLPTVRTLWENFSREEPTGYELLSNAVQGLYNWDLSGEEAAELVHKGLDWYYR